jgi:hypothetical protein
MPTVKMGGLNKAITKIFIDSRAETLVRANRALRAVVVKNWGDVIKSTPVDTGRARGNWFLTQNSPSSSKESGTQNKGPAYVFTNTNAAMFGTKWFLTNNLPYILKLEFGGYGTISPKKVTAQGFSKQAPAGMVRINTARFPAQIARAFKATV